MATKSKNYYCERIYLSLRDQFPNRDIKIDPREMILRFDDMANEIAKTGFLSNWKSGLNTSIGDQFITEWTDLTVTDPANKAPSYVQFPANYADLPDNGGIDQVFFVNDFTVAKKKYFDPVIITTYKARSAYRSNLAANLEGRISCYPRNGYLYFDRGDINAKYGKIGMRLVVKDSSAIADDAPYPIPADLENLFIQEGVKFFRERLLFPQDLVRDSVDKVE